MSLRDSRDEKFGWDGRSCLSEVVCCQWLGTDRNVCATRKLRSVSRRNDMNALIGGNNE